MVCGQTHSALWSIELIRESQEKLVLQRRQAMAALNQKMDTYNNSLDIETLIEQLLSVVKDQVCR